MKKRYAALIAVLIIGAGCTHYGALEEDYGKSYTMVMQNQMLNPDASKNLEPVSGINGKAAEQIIQKYTDSFNKGCEQPAQQSFTIAPKSGAKGTGQDVYGK